MDEADLRRHLDEAHRQMLERDNTYRFHDEELRRRDHEIEQLTLQIEQLHEQLTEVQAWARELEAGNREMQATRAWRFAVRLRSLGAGARRLVRVGR
jgi:prefoldin subunit 5